MRANRTSADPRTLILPCACERPEGMVAAVERAEREARDCGRILLTCRWSPAADCRVFEDAVRYLAARRGIPVDVERPR